jgi:hypothetical protein
MPDRFPWPDGVPHVREADPLASAGEVSEHDFQDHPCGYVHRACANEGCGVIETEQTRHSKCPWGGPHG